MKSEGKNRGIEYTKIFNVKNSLKITSVKGIGKMDRYTGPNENNNITFAKDLGITKFRDSITK